PLQFDPGAPLPPPPAVTVTPSSGLADGQTVTVAGTSFGASSPVTVGECATDGQPNPTLFDLTGCSLSFANAITDGHGAFTTPLTVSATVPLFDGTSDDCAVSGDCVIVGVDVFDMTL